MNTKQTFEEYLGQIVIYGFDRIGILEEVIETREDFYYKIRTNDLNKKYTHISCVIPIISLKGRLNQDEYKTIQDDFDFNN